MHQKSPLRFVILCDTLSFPKWQADCLREVIASGLAVPVGIVINASARNRANWRSRWRKRDYALWRIFSRFYVEVFCKATIAEDMTSYFDDIPSFYAKPEKVGRFGETFSDEALNFIKNWLPHFVLRFGFGILKGEILQIAPYGVWSYHHGEPSKFRGQPPGFWEIYSGSPVAGSILQVLSDELDAGTVLHSGFFQTTAQSYAKTRDAIYLGSSSWVRRTCAAIQENGWPLKTSAKLVSRGPIWRLPKNLEMVHFFVITARNFLRVQLTYRLFRQTWNCGVVSAPIHTVAGLDGIDKQIKALEKIHWMKCPPHYFIADPFGYELGDNSKIKILFELFDERKRRGVIASTSYAGSHFDAIKIILDSPVHLSYPYVMKQGEEIYCVPEHSAERNISAFRLTQSGNTDLKVTMFSRSELIDATIFQWNGKYWLFGLDDSKSKNTDLHVYYADSWQGPWRAHPLNPVKTDIRSSRPGGTPFVHEGKLYRPAQDCSTHYGSAVVINEIISLDKSDFEERPIARVQPWKGSEYQYGVHTLSSVGNLTLIDGAEKNCVLW
jgi:hypothetical protein